MSNPNPKTDHLEPYQWPSGKSGNPKGNHTKTKHLSTHIQEMLHTEIDFKLLVSGRGKGAEYKSFKGMPIQAIIAVAIHQSMLGDKDAREWLARHGYGIKVNMNTADPVQEVLERFGLIDKKQEGDENDAGQAEGTES